MNKKLFIGIIIVMFFSSVAFGRSDVMLWGPTQGNYRVCSVLEGIGTNLSQAELTKIILGAKPIYKIVKQLKGKAVADAYVQELVKGNAVIRKALPEYNVGIGYGNGIAVSCQVMLDDVLKKHLRVLGVDLYINDKKISIDIPVYDLIQGYQTASCFNPCINESSCKIPTPKIPVPTPTPGQPGSTPTPSVPTFTPTPNNPQIIYNVNNCPVYGSKLEMTSNQTSLQSWDLFTIVKTWINTQTEQASSTPSPEMTPTTVHCDPTGTPPPTPPDTDLVTPVPTSPPVNPTVVHCPTEVTGIPTSTTDPGKPYTPPDGILVGTPGTATTTSTSSNTLSVPSDSVLVNKKGR